MDKRYPPMPAHRRLLIFVLALAATSTLWFMLIYRPGDTKRDLAPQAPNQSGCANSHVSGCVGGKAEVIAVPPRAALASAP